MLWLRYLSAIHECGKKHAGVAPPSLSRTCLTNARSTEQDPYDVLLHRSIQMHLSLLKLLQGIPHRMLMVDNGASPKTYVRGKHGHDPGHKQQTTLNPFIEIKSFLEFPLCIPTCLAYTYLSAILCWKCFFD
jgi:hypothetical protein